MLPSDDVIIEHAYLVSRRVRLLAVCGTIDDSERNKVAMRDKLNAAAVESAGSQDIVPIPFLANHPDFPQVTVGFASHSWVIDTHEWIQQNTLPSEMACRIIGLLHGYSGEAIAQFERNQAGWRT